MKRGVIFLVGMILIPFLLHTAQATETCGLRWCDGVTGGDYLTTQETITFSPAIGGANTWTDFCVDTTTVRKHYCESAGCVCGIFPCWPHYKPAAADISCPPETPICNDGKCVKLCPRDYLDGSILCSEANENLAVCRLDAAWRCRNVDGCYKWVELDDCLLGYDPDRICIEYTTGGGGTGASCLACGGAGQYCCKDRTCGANLLCTGPSTGSCTACGANGQQCCAGNTCGAGLSCNSGACTPIVTCTNECTPGTKQCAGNGVQTCGNYDADSCTEWSTAVGCAVGQNCQGGECTAIPCTNECTTGAKQCSGNGVQTCGNYDADSCTEWSTSVACSATQICQGGSCVTPCTDECSPSGTKATCTTPFTSQQVCGNFDADTCLEWQTTTCSVGQKCIGTSCQACGANGQQCCPENQCTSSSSICQSGTCIPRCGGVGEPCCTTGQACTGELVCDPTPSPVCKEIKDVCFINNVTWQNAAGQKITTAAANMDVIALVQGTEKCNLTNSNGPITLTLLKIYEKDNALLDKNDDEILAQPAPSFNAQARVRFPWKAQMQPNDHIPQSTYYIQTTFQGYTNKSGELEVRDLCPAQGDLVYPTTKGEAPIQRCTDYNEYTGAWDKKTICEIDCANVSGQERATLMQDPQLVGEISDVKCAWENNRCDLVYTFTPTGNPPPPPGAGRICKIVYVSEEECAEGKSFHTVTYKAVNTIPNGLLCDAGCGEGKECTKEVVCPTLVQLPFFTLFNVIGAAFLIALVYLLARGFMPRKRAPHQSAKRKR